MIEEEFDSEETRRIEKQLREEGQVEIQRGPRDSKIKVAAFVKEEKEEEAEE